MPFDKKFLKNLFQGENPPKRRHHAKVVEGRGSGFSQRKLDFRRQAAAQIRLSTKDAAEWIFTKHNRR